MLSSYRASHEAWLPSTSEPAALRALRERALEGFEAHGFPTKKVEAWKYTSTAKLARTPWVHDHGPLFEAMAGAVIGQHALPGAIAEIVLVNGAFAPGLSRIADLPEGVELMPLHEHADLDMERLDPATWPALPNAARTTLGPYRMGQAQVGDSAAERPESAFDLLNTAFLQDGVVLRVAPDVQVAGTIHVVLVGYGAEAPIAAHPRVWIDVGRHASVTVVERHFAAGDEPTFVNAVVDARLEDGAHLAHHVWRLEGDRAFHVEHQRVTVGRDARYESHVAWLGGSWSRNDLEVRFTAPGGEALCTGVTLGDGTQHVDHHTWMRHEVPRCTSRELYKGVYGGKARGIFNGMVYIARDAQRSDADLSNKNLLISERAQVQTKPELEIHADDVKAAHGCTVGQLDPNQLAYLRTRGISAEQARRMLTVGFVMDLVEEIGDATLRETTGELIQARLHALHGAE